jgi:hypothetical protein
MNIKPNIEAVTADELVEQEALAGAPNFYDIPDDLKETLEKQTLLAERMFWLRATHIPKNKGTETLVRRAIYAEQRAWEMENRAGEMALITEGAVERIKELEAQIKELAQVTS